MGSDERRIVGKWEFVPEGSGKYDCYPIRNFLQIEFLADKSAIYYHDMFGLAGEIRPVDITASYSFPGGKRIKIVLTSGIGGTDLLDYELSGNTLKLCQGSNCCDLVRK